MKIFGRILFLSFEFIALFISVAVIVGVFSSDPFPAELLFWNCVSWGACLISSSVTYFLIALAPLIVLHWALSFKKMRQGKS